MEVPCPKRFQELPHNTRLSCFTESEPLREKLEIATNYFVAISLFLWLFQLYELPQIIFVDYKLVAIHKMLLFVAAILQLSRKPFL